MLKEALQLLQKTAVDAAGAKNEVHLIETLPGRPENYAIVGADGTVNEYDKDPPPRGHQIGCVTEVPDFIKYMKETRNFDPVVWLDESGIRIVLNDGRDSHRSDTAICPLTLTREYKLLDEQPWFEQKQMLRVFRNLLWDALGDQRDPLIAIFKAMIFTARSAGHGNIETGRSSYGSDITHEVVSDAGKLADFERLVLRIRCFDDPSLTSRRLVDCVLDDKPDEHKFCIVPLGQSLTDAMAEELDHIETMLGACDCPVFRGHP